MTTTYTLAPSGMEAEEIIEVLNQTVEFVASGHPFHDSPEAAVFYEKTVRGMPDNIPYRIFKVTVEEVDQ